MSKIYMDRLSSTNEGEIYGLVKNPLNRKLDDLLVPISTE